MHSSWRTSCADGWLAQVVGWYSQVNGGKSSRSAAEMPGAAAGWFAGTTMILFGVLSLARWGPGRPGDQVDQQPAAPAFDATVRTVRVHHYNPGGRRPRETYSSAGAQTPMAMPRSCSSSKVM